MSTSRLLYYSGTVHSPFDPTDTDPLDGGEEKAFETALRRRGLETFVVPVERSDWLKVAGAVFTLDFWKGTCRPDGPAYNWYLQKVISSLSLLLFAFGGRELGRNTNSVVLPPPKKRRRSHPHSSRGACGGNPGLRKEEDPSE